MPNAPMKLAKHVRFREEKFGGVLFETRSEKVFALNAAAAAVVREIRSGGDEHDITARLLRQFRDPGGVVTQQAGEFIAELKRKGLIEDATGERAAAAASTAR